MVIFHGYVSHNQMVIYLQISIGFNRTAPLSGPDHMGKNKPGIRWFFEPLINGQVGVYSFSAIAIKTLNSMNGGCYEDVIQIYTNDMNRGYS